MRKRRDVDGWMKCDVGCVVVGGGVMAGHAGPELRPCLACFWVPRILEIRLWVSSHAHDLGETLIYALKRRYPVTGSVFGCYDKAFLTLGNVRCSNCRVSHAKVEPCFFLSFDSAGSYG